MASKIESLAAQSNPFLAGLISVLIQTLLQSAKGQKLFNGAIEITDVTLEGATTGKVKVAGQFYKIEIGKWKATKKIPKKKNP